MYHRHATRPLLDALADTPVVLLLGPRQAGKSTLAKQLIHDTNAAQYLTFDDAAVLAAAQADPDGFVAGLDERELVVLDEVQRVPELFLSIKGAVDRDRRPGRFLLTGSADVFMLPRVADSLAGRMEMVYLWPLSQGEIAGVRERFIDALFDETLPTPPVTPLTRDALVETIVRGGYPEALARPAAARRRAFFSAYLNSILSRDVRDIAGIADLGALARLLILLAGRVGGLVNAADLSRALEIPATTLKRYFGLVETTFLVQTLPAWRPSLGGRVVKSPKLYYSDTGLLAHQASVTPDRVAADPSALGPLLENFVITELRKQSAWNETAPTLWHYRMQDGQEVDLVLEAPDGRVVGVEVKAAATLSGREFNGLRHLATRLGKRFVRGVVLYTGAQRVAFGPNLYALPVQALWAPWYPDA